MKDQRYKDVLEEGTEWGMVVDLSQAALFIQGEFLAKKTEEKLKNLQGDSQMKP